MSEALSISRQLTLPGLDSGTSLAGSPSGLTRSDSPVSPTMPASGPARVRASRSAAPVGGGGFTDVRHLWPPWFALIRECRPAVVFGEQVSSGDGLAWFDAVHADLEGAGYAIGAADLCAAGVGAPHIRQRLYFVAYADGGNGRLHLSRGEPRRGDAQAVGRGEAGGMADRCGSGLEVVGEQSARRELAATERGGAAGIVEHASGARGRRNARCDDRTEAPSPRSRPLDRRSGDEPCAAGPTRGLADADIADAFDGDESRGRGLVQPQANATTGFWYPADWLPCVDGKSRPVEPGTFPLATGVTGRVGRLRAYGNGLCAEQAATFIRAAIGACEVTP